MKKTKGSYSFAYRYNKLVWFTIFALVFLLSLDFWNWGKSKPFFLGLPFWIIYFIILTLSLTPLFYLFSRDIWRE